MMSPILRINFDNIEDAFPAFVTMIMMPLTYSIAEGIMFGCLSYVGVHLLIGKVRKLNLFLIILAVLFVLKLVF